MGIGRRKSIGSRKPETRRKSVTKRKALVKRHADNRPWFIQDGEQLERVMRDHPY